MTLCGWEGNRGHGGEYWQPPPGVCVCTWLTSLMGCLPINRQPAPAHTVLRDHRTTFVSPLHRNAEGLMFYQCEFFFFSTPNLVWLHWTDPNQTWTHSLMTAIWRIWSKLTRAFTPTGWLTFNFDRTYLCNKTWYQQVERNLSIYRDSPTCPQIWWTLVQKRLRTVGTFLATSKFLHRETLPALPHQRYITDSTFRHLLCGGRSL